MKSCVVVNSYKKYLGFDPEYISATLKTCAADSSEIIHLPNKFHKVTFQTFTIFVFVDSRSPNME